MKTTTRFRKAAACTGLALGSLLAVPAVAHAAATSDCYTSCPPPTVPTTTPGTVTGTTVPLTPPTTDPGDPGATRGTSVGLTSTANGSSSLPFTGVDVAELAAVGLGAVAVGGLLTYRRRRSA